MELEKIGFYSLENYRAENASIFSPLWRCELIITSNCNFNCPYCRGTQINHNQNIMEIEDIKTVINLWADNNIQNIRFSGGEPTLHPNIIEIIKYTKKKCTDIKHIAISTNGYNDINLYKELINLGVNDFSISLDACCSSTGDIMSGGIKGSWNKVISNIKKLSKLTYVTVGTVLNENNMNEAEKTILLASSLGVSDIRIITAAQMDNINAFNNINISSDILEKHPILKYRINNFKNNRNVRGINKNDFNRCHLMLDDMIIKGNYHYPCVIFMREKEQPISTIKNKTIKEIRKERLIFLNNHHPYNDEICKKNCLDVCIDYNNKYEEYHVKKNKLERIHI